VRCTKAAPVIFVFNRGTWTEFVCGAQEPRLLFACSEGKRPVGGSCALGDALESAGKFWRVRCSRKFPPVSRLFNRGECRAEGLLWRVSGGNRSQVQYKGGAEKSKESRKAMSVCLPAT
jgi:hypothetical protein